MNTNERWVARSVSKTPPPDTVQIDELAHAYGLIDGLRMSTSAIPYRCCWCDKMQGEESVLVWVPEGICVGHPAWLISEVARTTTHNGSATGWCFSCALQLSAQCDKMVARRSLMQRLLDWMRA